MENLLEESAVIRTGLLIFALALLAGCATGYQGAGLTGGHFQRHGPGPLEKITFSGNGFVDAVTIQKYALYRCAEATKEKGKKYFVIYDTLVAASMDKAASLPNIGSIGNKPIAFAFVLMLDAPRDGAMETGKVLKELDAFVKQKNSQLKS